LHSDSALFLLNIELPAMTLIIFINHFKVR
jgi:hypothetical protein